MVREIIRFEVYSHEGTKGHFEYLAEQVRERDDVPYCAISFPVTEATELNYPEEAEENPEDFEELSSKELKRQDFVDSAIQDLFAELRMGGTDLQWDIGKISAVREAIEDAFGMDDGARYAFYPYLKRKKT